MSADSVLRFDRYELQLSERQLLRDGQEVHLRAKAFDLLVALARRPGELVTKVELLETVWPGLVVEDNNVATQMVALRKALGSELILTVPGRGYRLAALPRGATESSRPAPEAEPASGPALFGRERDLGHLSQVLATPGCVTLVGPGGVGKTSLARALCAGLGEAPCWVDLAALGPGEPLLPPVARALGTETREGETLGMLAGPLQAARWLVLDNAEHLVEAVAALVSQLLAVAPGLHVLVTSQVPLAIHDERIERIEPLELPVAGMTDERALEIGSVAMFVDRVRAADSRFRFDPESLPLVRQLCTELDGMPLALEMAAARVPLLGLRRVRDALAERFAMLRRAQRDTPARQRTLQAALDWSYRLLSADEQRLFRQLAVFARGFTLDLLVDMHGDQERWSIADRLALLVDRSLVSVDHGREPPRYRLLETMRGYAQERLGEAGEEEVARLRYAEALGRLFQADFHRTHGSADVPYLASDDEMENAREALSWAMRHQPAMAVRLASHAAYVQAWTNWALETYVWLSACRPLVESGRVDLPTQAVWWRNMASQTLVQGRRELGLEFGRRAAEVCRAAGDDVLLFNTLSVLGRAIPVAGRELDEVLAEFHGLAARHPEWSEPWVRVLSLDLSAHASQLKQDPEAARNFVREAVECARVSGLTRVEGYITINHARLLRELGLAEEALHILHAWLDTTAAANSAARQRRYINVVCRALICRILCELGRFDEALADASVLWADTRLGGVPATVECVLALGLARAGRLRTAALLLGHLKQYFAGASAPTGSPADDIDRATALTIAGLGKTEVARLMEKGRALDDTGVRQLLVAAAQPGASSQGAVA